MTEIINSRKTNTDLVTRYGYGIVMALYISKLLCDGGGGMMGGMGRQHYYATYHLQTPSILTLCYYSIMYIW